MKKMQLNEEEKKFRIWVLALYAIIGVIIGSIIGVFVDSKWLSKENIEEYKMIASEVFNSKNSEEIKDVQHKYKVKFVYKENTNFKYVRFDTDLSSKTGGCSIIDKGNGNLVLLKTPFWTLTGLFFIGFISWLIGLLMLKLLKK